jgi:AhpD family alkylhydroperoxidase
VPRITPIDPLHALGTTRLLYTSVQARQGSIPNLYRVIGHSPAALGALLSMEGLLTEGALDERVREQLALVVAEISQSEYCLREHTALASRAGLSAAEINEARCARSADPRTAAMLGLARAIVIWRGDVDDHTIAEARAAGLTDAELLEVVAHVAMQILRNYTAHLSGVRSQLPAVAQVTHARTPEGDQDNLDQRF